MKKESMNPNELLTSQYSPGVQFTLEEILASKNLAAELDEMELLSIGRVCRDEYNADLDSRAEWQESYHAALEMAMQIRQHKTFPWSGASNVKYPLITMAATEFASRITPLLFNDVKMVKPLTSSGASSETKKAAEEIAEHMHWQLTNGIPGWVDSQDQNMHILPIVGTTFKKSYHDPTIDQIQSELILPDDIVVDYYASSVVECERISHRIRMTPNQIESRQNAGIYQKVNWDFISTDPTQEMAAGTKKLIEETIGMPGQVTSTTPAVVIEQHRLWDLDGDGLAEPYIITFDATSGWIYRIKANFSEASIRRNTGIVQHIATDQYFTKYIFLPSFDGSFYGVGFGRLLGSLNPALDTLINQLIDSGTLSNTQGGFFTRGTRMRAGEIKIKMGTWLPIDAHGGDLRKSIVPYPTKDPSNVLFTLFGALLQAGEKVGSITDPLTGNAPGADISGASLSMLITQGEKVFSAALKRVYRSAATEYSLIFQMNRKYMSKYVFGGNQTVTKATYNKFNGVILPNADPTVISGEQKVAQARAALEMVGSPYVSEKTAIKMYFEALGMYNVEDLIIEEPAPPTPTPKELIEQAKLQLQDKQYEVMKLEAIHKIGKIKADTLRATASALKILSENNFNVDEQAVADAVHQLSSVRDSFMADMAALTGGYTDNELGLGDNGGGIDQGGAGGMAPAPDNGQGTVPSEGIPG